MFRKIQEARENDEGFTLIELLVVVIIIGILAAIAIPVFLNQRERAWAGSVESDLRNAAIQVETYFTQNSEYPAAGTTSVFTEAQLPSEGVTLDIVRPAAADAATATSFCMEGEHAQLLDGSGAPVTFAYDSDLGGLQGEGTTC